MPLIKETGLMIRKKYALEDHEENGLCKDIKIVQVFPVDLHSDFYSLCSTRQKKECNDTPPPQLTFPPKKEIFGLFGWQFELVESIRIG